MKRIAIFLTIILSAIGCGPRDNNAITTESTSPPDSTVEDGANTSSPTSTAPSETAATEPATSADDTQDALADANATAGAGDS